MSFWSAIGGAVLKVAHSVPVLGTALTVFDAATGFVSDLADDGGDEEDWEG